MYCISDQQIDFILDDISRHGIKIENLRQNLLDHICIIIEQNLEPGGDFEAFYTSTIKTFYKTELKEIEDETIFLMKHKQPFIVFTKNQFFLLLFIFFIGPFLVSDILWLVNNYIQKSGLYIPISIWGPTVVYSLFPLLVLLVLFFTPDHLDPLFPKKSRILIGAKPFITIIPANTAGDIKIASD